MALGIEGGLMNKGQANQEARKIFEEWQEKKRQIEKEAKKEGTWKNDGLDSNNHLFKKLDSETKEKLDKLAARINKNRSTL